MMQSLLYALFQLCAINNFISFVYYCLDCASDNVATHKLCYSLGILPVIDINRRSSNKNLYLTYKDISKNGRTFVLMYLNAYAMVLKKTETDINLDAHLPLKKKILVL